MHKLVIISGPGGSGKDTIIRELIKDPNLNLKRLVNHTSRPPRVGEIDGVNRHFLSKEQFEQEIQKGEMLEYEVMQANSQYYGTHKSTLMRDLETTNVICDKMPVGALELKQHFGDRAITIFVDVDDTELKSRLQEGSRIVEQSQIAARLDQATKERTYKDQYDFVITNQTGHLQEVVAQVASFIRPRIVQE